MSSETLSAVLPYLNRLDTLLHEAVSDGKTYAEPALKNLGAIAIPIVREVVSPASFRNADPEITDIMVANVRRVRAVANKFKYGERSRGLQVLRYFKAGGAMAQNRTEFGDRDPPSKGYDLNTLTFGDSANRGKHVLPVKACVQYSDAVSLMPYGACVDDTFHNRASEDGTLYDAVDKKNSVNLFERHFILPGTLLVQVLTLNGRTAPPEVLTHILLSIGLAGAYGGQTSIYGINVRNHIVGIYGGLFEKAVASPYELVKLFGSEAPKKVEDVAARLDAEFGREYSAKLSGRTVAELQAGLIGKLEKNDAELAASYRESRVAAGKFFDAWFGMGGDKAKKKRADEAEEESNE
ncbi:MAG: type I-D CRISPR-associated protein Cas7/Csc2 [Hyphomicrobiaceae bacterium]